MVNDFKSDEWEGFEWDEGNAPKNWIKHNVSPAECEQVFFNRPLLTAGDAGHSQREEMLYALGQTDAERCLFVSFTIRHKRVRVISARDMSRKERRLYNEKVDSSL